MATSVMARRPRTITALVMAPMAAAVTPSTMAARAGRRPYLRKYGAGRMVSRKAGKCRDCSHGGAGEPGDEVTDETGGDHDGPGVIMATATASTNCWASSHPKPPTTPP